MTETPVLPPAPEIDHDSAPYWEGLRQESLRLQRCDDCDRHRYPPMPNCPYCASARCTLAELSGRGSVYSFVVAHQAFNPAFADDVPYVIATVDLDEGPRIAVRADNAGDIDFGQRVCSVFDGWSELRVVPERSA